MKEVEKLIRLRRIKVQRSKLNPWGGIKGESVHFLGNSSYIIAGGKLESER